MSERVFNEHTALLAAQIARETNAAVICTISGIKITVHPTEGDSLEAVRSSWQKAKDEVEARERNEVEKEERRRAKIRQLKEEPGFTVVDSIKWASWIDLQVKSPYGISLIEQTARWACIVEKGLPSLNPHLVGLDVGLDSGAYTAAAHILRDVWSGGPAMFETLKAGKHIYEGRNRS